MIFLSYKSFWDKCSNDPRSMTSRFRVAIHFEISARNDPKDIEHYEVKSTEYMSCVTSLPESQMSVHSLLWPAVSQLQAILRQLYRMTLNTNFKVQHICYWCPRFPNFSPFCSTTSRFDLQDILILVHWRTPKLPWALQSQTYPIDALLVSSIPKLQSLLLYGQPFLSYRPFEKSASSHPKMTLNIKRSKVPHMCVANIPESQISPHFVLRLTVFKIQSCRWSEMNRITSE